MSTQTHRGWIEEQDDPVLINRYDWFVKLGFHDEIAECLAMGSIDWHELEALIKKGCPSELALRILI